jgi:hypothetical protein
LRGPGPLPVFTHALAGLCAYRADVRLDAELTSKTGDKLFKGVFGYFAASQRRPHRRRSEL